MNNLDATTAGYTELASETANQGKGWQPIGYTHWDGQQWVGEGFEGTFDGQGYEIRDLFINRPDEVEVGLFGVIMKRGIIQSVVVVNANVTGERGVGGLVGQNWEETVHNSYFTGSVIGKGMVGGLVGVSAGTISNSYSTGSVTGNSSVGGLVGDNAYGTVSNFFWDIETSGQATSDGGVGKTTAEMQDITTFSGAGWNITAVAHGETNSIYIWNIVDDVTYPFLNWQPVG